MVAALKHRGPDGQVVHVDGPVGLGHARLAIIDLAGGRQPLANEDGSVVVVCNGEIYNYRELRERLVRRGHAFRTHSDCEVLVHLWEERGRGMLDDLRGMFAFALYDRRHGVLFGARDRYGQKPLFYHADSRRVAFASEVKALLELPDVPRDVDLTALDQFLFYSFVPSPRTLFSGVKKLAAGCWFEVRVGTQPAEARPAEPIVTGRYWAPTFAPDDSLSEREHLDRVDAALNESVACHMVADVPIGVMLSGGIDSSLVTALAARHNPEPLETFSISFPNSPHDEGAAARAVARALKTRHCDFPFAPHDLPALLQDAADLFDQPLADTAALPLMTLSREIARHVKVVLTGDGGDELFAGYRKYRRMVGVPGRYGWLTRAVSRVCPPHFLAACAPDRLGTRRLRAKLAQTIAPAVRSEYRRWGWEGWERHALYQPQVVAEVEDRFCSHRQIDAEALHPLNAALLLDQGAVLADRLLLKSDYATMASGLESRAPLLDHRLADVAGRLPVSLKATPQQTKVALRDVARRYLPKEVVERRKKGFSMPLDQWYRHELRPFARECLLEQSVSLPRFFDRAAIERLLADHDAGQNHAGRIHTLVALELWCRRYLSE
jgi:asparagine synthase (glutamine-hydrolysing)